MSNATYFVQECPTCCRRLQIRVEYLGKRVVCQHCQARLVAIDPSNRCDKEADHTAELLRRANELLDSVSQRRSEM
jgi:hypothetical protein